MSDPEIIGLTDQELKTVRFIVAYQNTHGYPPTTREIMDEFGWTSPASVQDVKRQLRGKGVLSWIPGQPRTLTICDGW